MKQLVKRNKNVQEWVWDSVEELKRDVPDAIVVNGDNCNDAKEGMYFQYSNGKVSVIRKVRPLHGGNTNIIKTILNEFIATYGNIVPGEFLNYSAHSIREVDFDEVDARKIRLVEAWLLQGMDLQQAVAKYYYSWLSKQSGKKGRPKDETRRYAYLFLSQGSWFSKLMAENRVLRDKYASLVGALEAAGVTQEYIASKIKEFLDSDNPKLSSVGLNKAVELLILEEKKQLLLVNKPGNQLPSFLASVETHEEAKLLNKGRNGNDASSEELHKPEQDPTGQEEASRSNGEHLSQQDSVETVKVRSKSNSQDEIDIDSLIDPKEGIDW